MNPGQGGYISGLSGEWWSESSGGVPKRLDAVRQGKWMETVETLSFQTSSITAWSLLKKLERKSKQCCLSHMGNFQSI